MIVLHKLYHVLVDVQDEVDGELNKLHKINWL